MGEIWNNFKNHTKSSRFFIIIFVLGLSFISAIIHTIFTEFPFVVFAGILNGLGLGLYITKTVEPGARKRRENNRTGEDYESH